MSVLNKLIIQGIRSFGPKEEDKQMIKFYSPLTLILGENGTGKTTIIECLKYVTTGDTPPGTNRGQSFVCDPKMVNEASVKAQVKLQLTDTKGKEVIVTRSIESVQKISKISIQTLDTTITRRGIDGNPVSISSKCADVDADMCLSLGVSKAVLNYVVFCHQEESNWPLDEGKKVKEKFDAIFAATKYIKCLEKIREIRLRLKKEHDMCDKEIKYLEEFKKEAETLKSKLKRSLHEIEINETSLQNIINDMKPLEEKLSITVQKRKEVLYLSNEIEKISIMLNENMKSQESLKNNIKTIFHGDVAVLKNTLTNYDNSLCEKQNNLLALSSDLEKIEKKENELSVIYHAELQKVGNLEFEKRLFEEKQAVLDTVCSKVADDFLLDRNVKLNSNMDEIYYKAKQLLDDDYNKLQELKSAICDAEKRKQEELEDIKLMVMQKKVEMKTLMKDINKYENVLLKTETSLKNFDAIENNFKKLDEKLLSMQNEMEEFQKNENISNLQELKSSLGKKQERAENILNELDNNLKKLHDESENETTLSILAKEKVSKENLMFKMFSKHEKNLKSMFGEVPDKNLLLEFQKYLSETKSNINILNEEISSKQLFLCEYSNKRNSIFESLQDTEKNIAKSKQEISNACKEKNYYDCFEDCQKNITCHQNEISKLNGAQHFLKSYIEKLSNKQCCPLCCRTFSKTKDSNEILNNLKLSIQNIPQEIQRLECLLQNEQKYYETLLELKTVVKKLDNDEISMPNLKSEINNVDLEMEKISKVVENKKAELLLRKQNENMACSIQNDVISIHQLRTDIEQIETNMKLYTYSFSKSNLPSFKELSNKKDSVKTDLDVLKIQIRSVIQKIEDYNETMQRLANGINFLKGEKIKNMNELQELNHLKSKQVEVTENIINLKSKLLNLENEHTALEDNLEKCTINFNSIVLNNKDCLIKSQNCYEEKKTILNKFAELKQEIESFINAGKLLTLSEQKQNIEEYQNKLQNLKETKSHLFESINQLQSDISDNQIKKRDLQDNLQLLEYKSKANELNSNLQCLHDKLSTIDNASLNNEYENLELRQWNLKKQQFSLEASLKEKKMYVNELEVKLQEDMIKNAEKKFVLKTIDKKVRHLAVDDLSKYYVALDWAIMQFHHDKMKQINHIIRELWKLTYKGNDIDYIEIKTEENTISAGIDKRKTYNYRVIMVRNGCEMDMRGRCSAGQKVLACLIIRIALAETFAVNCSVLALDEPTTNLDRENIESLSLSLLDIVQRIPVSRMQLIVITHDEEFLERLRRADYIGYYYIVNRNDYGLSFIKKITNH